MRFAIRFQDAFADIGIQAHSSDMFFGRWNVLGEVSLRRFL
jgi:hypothetical protein